MFAVLSQSFLDINNQSDVRSVLAAIAHRGALLLGVTGCGVFLITPDQKALELAATNSLPDSWIGTRLAVGEGVCGQVLATGKSVQVEDYPAWKDHAQKFLHTSFKSTLGVPLVQKGRLSGVVVFSSTTQHSFTAEEVQLAELYAGLAAVAYENARLFQAAQREMEERQHIELAEREQRILANALDQTASTLTSSLNLGEVLDSILEIVGRVVPHDAATIMLVEHGRVRIVRSKGYVERGLEKYVSNWNYPLDRLYNLSHMAETGLPLTIPDTREDPHWVSFEEITWLRSTAAAPIRVKGALVGFVHLDSATPNFFTHMHAERLQAFADHVGAAIENARLFEETQKKARQFALLNEITQSAISAPDLLTMLEVLANRLGELIDADGAYITLWNEEEQRAIPMAAYHMEAERYRCIPSIPGEHSFTASVLEAQRVLAADDVMNSPYIDPKIAGDYNEKSVMAIPLIADGKKLGAALVGFHGEHHFSIAEVNLAEQSASQIALAVARMLSLDTEREQANALRRANTFITALSHVAARVSSAIDPEAMLETLGQELNLLGLNSMVIEMTPENGGMSIRHISIEAEKVAQIEDEYGVPLARWVIPAERTREFSQMIASTGIYFSNPDPITHFFTQAIPGLTETIIRRLSGVSTTTSIVCLPLATKEDATGFLILWGEDMQEKDLPALSIFASQVAVTLENASLYATVQRLAITDDLSGLYNRRGLIEICNREIDRMRRFYRPLSLVILDIDHFKRVNDRYGHLVGDQIIQELGKRCLENIRGIDVGGRYGGEEFVFLLIENNFERAMKVADRLRVSIAEKPFQTDKGLVSITVSLGVVEIESTMTDFWPAVEKADKALYRAKNLGRDQVAGWNTDED